MTTRRWPRGALAVLAAVLLTSAAPSAVAQERGREQSQPGGDAELTQLLKARHEAAMEALELEEKLFAAGLAGLGDIAYAMRCVRESLLDFPIAPEDRVKALTEYVGRARKLDELCAKRVEMGVARRGEAARARYVRLDAEIALLRATRQAGEAR